MQPSDILRKQHLDTPLAGGSGSVVESEILVDVQHVSKKFCRDLKKSLWYGLKDVFTEMNPWQPRSAALPAAPSGNDLRPAEFWAVNDVSFQLRRGECLGLIGHNGAGKTTLLKMLNGLIKPDSGSITMRGRVGALIALGAGFNPILTGRENVYINGAILGLSKKEIDDQIDSIIDFAEIREFIDSPVQSYSSGMQVRLGFAVATAMKPDVLILDEVLAVGDANFRSKCYQRIGNILADCAVIIVSHDAYSIRRICNEVLWLKRGNCMFHGDTEAGMRLYNDDAPAIEGMNALMLCADYVSNSKCESKVTETVVNGEDTVVNVSIRITFESVKHVELGLSMANIVAPGEVVVGQSLLNNCVPPIHEGFNDWEFSIRDLHLARGQYAITLGFFERSNKRFVLNLRNHIRFEVQGSPRYGPLYAPIAFGNTTMG